MKYTRTILPFALCAVLAACDVSDTSMMNGAITLKDGMVTLHAHGASDAIISSTGDLQIDDKAISLTPSQRGLLMLYNHNVQDVHDIGLEMGKTGAQMGAKALKNAMNKKSDAQQDQDADAGAEQLKQLSLKICQDQANIKTVQDQLTAELPAFKPYGDIVGADSVTSCQSDAKN
jgi:hypothetical protein